VILNDIIDNAKLDIVNSLHLLESLQLRLKLIKNDYSSKQEYDKNEIDIKVHQTKMLINKINSTINKKQEALILSYSLYMKHLEDVML